MINITWNRGEWKYIYIAIISKLLNKFHRFVYYCWIFFCTYPPCIYKYIFGNFLLEQREQIKCYLCGRDWSWFTSCFFFSLLLHLFVQVDIQKFRYSSFSTRPIFCNNLGAQYARVRNLWNKIFTRNKRVCWQGPVAKQLENTGLNYYFFFFSYRSKDINFEKSKKQIERFLITVKFYYLWALCTLFSYVFIYFSFFFLTFTKLLKIFIARVTHEHFYPSNNKNS